MPKVQKIAQSGHTASKQHSVSVRKKSRTRSRSPGSRRRRSSTPSKKRRSKRWETTYEACDGRVDNCACSCHRKWVFRSTTYARLRFCFVLFSKDTFNTAFSSMSITGVKSSPRLTKTCFPKSPTQCAMKILMLHNYLKLGTKGFLKQVKMIEKYFIPKWLMNTSEWFVDRQIKRSILTQPCLVHR